MVQSATHRRHHPSRALVPAAPRPVDPPAAGAAWTVQAVRATFLRRGELVPPLFWAASSSGDPHHIAAAAELAARSRAQGTNRAYGRHVEQWLTWAEAKGVCPLPAAPEAVQEFLLEHVLVWDEDGEPVRDGDGTVTGRVVMGTVTQLQAALTRLHHLAGLPSPFHAAQLATLMAGLRRTFVNDPRRAKAALTWDLLEELLAVPTRGATPSTLRAEAVRALHRATGATAGQLSRLLVTAVTQTEQGLSVLLPPGHRGGPTVRHDLAGDGPGREAVAALRRWQSACRQWPGTALFRDSTGKALTRQGLHRILVTQPPPVLDAAGDGPQVRLAEVRDRTVLLVGWISALRRTNLAALTWSDLTRDETGWTAYIRRSKTDQEGKGATVAIPVVPAGSDLADPAAALDEWLAVMTAVLGSDPRRGRDVPVFPRIDRWDNVVPGPDGLPRGLSGAGINDIVQRAVRAAHLDERVHLTHAGRSTAPGTAPFGAHSLRAGFVTDGFARGVPESQLMRQTHHADARTLRQYIRQATNPSLVAASAVLQGLHQTRQGARATPPQTPAPVEPRKVARWRV